MRAEPEFGSWGFIMRIVPALPILSGRAAWKKLDAWAASAGVDEKVAASVRAIVAAVRAHGDRALRELALRFGDEVPRRFELSPEEVRKAADSVPRSARRVIERAARNIGGFARAVAKAAKPVRLSKGEVRTGLDWRPVDRAGCYVPAGRHPLPSTALMTALAARAAGVPEIVIACPRPVPEIVFAGRLAGVERFFRIGGAQAIAALALGTESVPKAGVIAGPSNAYVAEAKRQLQGEAGFDLIAGPSEVAVVADSSARPDRVALDLLAQAEHDPDACAWLLTDCMKLARAVASEIERLAGALELPSFVSGTPAGTAGIPPASRGAGRRLGPSEAEGPELHAGNASGSPVPNSKLETSNSKPFPSISLLVFKDLAECAEASNRIAPEHLALHVRRPKAWKPRFRHYGAMFLGGESSVAFGDYMAGPNHTLPTGRCARFQGGLTPFAFLRPQAWTRMGKGAVRLAEDTGAFADLEGLTAHAAAARARAGKHRP